MRLSRSVWAWMAKPRYVFLVPTSLAFVLYASTVAPTVTSEDSGELITAAYTLGIAHPPGYPLWCILGKLFTLLPVGTVAYRVNLLSAALGAVAVGVLALIVQRFTRQALLAIVTALVFAASRDFWNQCVVAEVYSLNVLLFLVLLYLALRFEDTRDSRYLYLGAFALGVGLTNHSTLGPLAIVFSLWVLLRSPEALTRPVLLLNLLGSFLLGLSIILYLPLRSAADPYVDWGNPESFSALLDHVLRRQYTLAAEPRPRTIVGQATLVGEFLGTFGAQFTPAVAALAVLGLWQNARREWRTCALLVVLFGLTSYGFIWLLNYTPDREDLHLTRVFFLPAHAVAAVWIALGLRKLDRTVLRRLPFHLGPRLRWAALLLPLLPILAHYHENNQTETYVAEDWGRNILVSLKPRAIIIPSSDHSTFPLMYLQAVEGLREDVIIADKYGYIDDSVFRALFLGDSPPSVAPPIGEANPDVKTLYLVEHSGRPVYFTTKTRIAGLSAHELVTCGLIFEAVQKGKKPDEAAQQALWEGFSFHGTSLEREPGDFSLDLILADYHYARGRYEILFGHEKEALAALERAKVYGQGIKSILNNLGGTLAEAGKAELAIPFLEEALKLDPDYELSIRNVSQAYFASKRYKDGVPWFEKAARMEPMNPLFCLGLARGYKELGKNIYAYTQYENALAIDPGDRRVYKEAVEFAKKAFGENSILAKIPPPPELAAETRDFPQVAPPRAPDPWTREGPVGTGEDPFGLPDTAGRF